MPFCESSRRLQQSSAALTCELPFHFRFALESKTKECSTKGSRRFHFFSGNLRIRESRCLQVKEETQAALKSEKNLRQAAEKMEYTFACLKARIPVPLVLLSLLCALASPLPDGFVVI